MKHRFLYRLPRALYLQGSIVKCWLLAVMFLAGIIAHAQDDYFYEDTVDEEVVKDEQIIAPPQATVFEPERPALRAVPDSAVSRVKKQKEFAYANDPAFWAQEPVEREDEGFGYHFYRFFSNDTVRMLFYGLLIAFFLFVIYRVMVVNNLYLFYRNKQSKPVIENDEGGIEDENLDEKIHKAVHDKQHRLAVRFMYLKALRLLNDQLLIRFHAQSTNYEYVKQMSGHKMGEEFRFLTRIYDYVWYGEFALNEDQFRVVHNNFQQFYNAVK
jgi:hypothetical protein